MSQAERDAAVPELREQSRQKYLLERKDKEFDLLKWRIKDEEEIFGKERLTEAELKTLEANKKLVQELEKKLLKEDIDENYHIPESYIDDTGKLDRSKKESLLTARYSIEKIEKTEQELWEEHQTEASKLEVMTNKKKKSEYDLVLDDEIDFISDKIINGDLSLDEINEEMEKNEVYIIIYYLLSCLNK